MFLPSAVTAYPTSKSRSVPVHERDEGGKKGRIDEGKANEERNNEEERERKGNAIDAMIA